MICVYLVMERSDRVSCINEDGSDDDDDDEDISKPNFQAAAVELYIYKFALHPITPSLIFSGNLEETL